MKKLNNNSVVKVTENDNSCEINQNEVNNSNTVINDKNETIMDSNIITTDNDTDMEEFFDSLKTDDTDETGINTELQKEKKSKKTKNMKTKIKKEVGETSDTMIEFSKKDSNELKPVVMNSDNNTEPKILRVWWEKLKKNPIKGEIYTNKNLDELVNNITENGKVIYTPLLVTPNMVIIDGEDRFDSGRLCDIEYFDVVIRDVEESEMVFVMISSNLQRKKTGEEIYNEIHKLYEYYGNRQGLSISDNTSTENGVSKEKKRNDDTQTKISKMLKVSKGVMYQLEEIHRYNPTYLKNIDNIEVKTNTVFSDMNKEIKEKKGNDLLEILRNKTYELEPTVFNTSSLNMLDYVSEESVDSIVTSIPYYHLIHYDKDGKMEIGWESTIEEYIDSLIPIFKNCFKVLKKSGSFFLNIGDSRNEDGVELNIPHRLLGKLIEICFMCVETIIWEKSNPRPIGNHSIYTPSFEYIFHLTKSTDFNNKGLRKLIKTNVIEENGIVEMNELYRSYKGIDWKKYWISDDFVKTSVNRKKINGNLVKDYHHPCPFVDTIPIPLILDSTDVGDTVLDPFCGVSTVGVICLDNQRKFVGFETNETYYRISKERLCQIMEINQNKPELKMVG